jgi:hypothetical protein
MVKRVLLLDTVKVHNSTFVTLLSMHSRQESKTNDATVHIINGANDKAKNANQQAVYHCLPDTLGTLDGCTADKHLG